MITKLREDYQFNLEEFEVSCDFCEYCKEYETEFGWNDLLDQMKEDGWKSIKVKDEWENKCITCVENKG